MNKRYLSWFLCIILFMIQFPGFAENLLIITPAEFRFVAEDLKDHKQATGMPAMVIELESIYSSQKFSGKDNPEKIKKAIDYFYKHNSIRYVLLVGNYNVFPVRWQYGHLVDGNTDQVYLQSDYYYADLYDEKGNFNDWDVDNDSFFGEIYRENLNPDNIDFTPDVAVGRIPCMSAHELDIYVTKIKNYEKNSAISKWFNNILMIQDGGTGNEWSVEIDVKENIIDFCKGFSAYRLYNGVLSSDYSGPVDDLPNTGNIIKYLDMGMGFVSQLSHGEPKGWKNLFYSRHVPGLSNDNMLPVIYSNGCQTAQFFGATLPYCEYRDIHGNIIEGVDVGTVGDTLFPRPDDLQPVEEPFDKPDERTISEALLFADKTGAIAYFGSTETGEPGFHKYVEEAFFEAYSLGKHVLGDMWKQSVIDFASRYHIDSIGPDGWRSACKVHTPSRFVLLGDPSLRVGGASPLYPLGGDFNRNYKGDRAVFRPKYRMWFYDYDQDYTADETIHPWAFTGDLPVSGDFDCDGHIDDVAVFRSSNQTWYYDYDHNGTTNLIIKNWGLKGDVPVAGDFDRDGFRDDVALFRPCERTWYYDLNHNGTTDKKVKFWANAGDLPFAGDLDGDGFADDVGVFRDSNKTKYGDVDHDGNTDLIGDGNTGHEKCRPAVIPMQEKDMVYLFSQDGTWWAPGPDWPL